MKIFLRLKHWQLFIIILLLLVNIVRMLIIFDYFRDPKSMEMFKYLSIYNLISFSIIFTWLFTLGKSLTLKNQKLLYLNFSYFKFSLFVILIYLIFESIIFYLILIHYLTNESFLSYDYFISSPLGLLSVFCYLYAMYFVAKSLKAVTNKKEMTFKDFRKEFFLLVLLPIGIWFIQPRINKIFAEEKEEKFG